MALEIPRKGIGEEDRSNLGRNRVHPGSFLKRRENRGVDDSN